ncbi:MAG TPA: hydroxysqualene dehydroxylase HpnE [Steroidobacteraceae bacterium]|nr:hydroxysqualene dehydroxylase HpnE [Steroidobacteraceae bacterium]
MAHLDKRVAIVGAGYAGMAAAVALAERGVRVCVFESGAVPGGRARRIVSQDRELDNGQHILAGAYTELFRLMRMVGVPANALLRIPHEIRYADGFVFRALWMPAPLGLAAGLLAARGVPFGERIGTLKFMAALRKRHWRIHPDTTVKDLLDANGQHGQLRQYLWEPLCVSALNTPLDQASANVFLAALRDTLGADAQAADLLLPRVDLSRLFPEPAAEFVRARGGDVKCGYTVKDLDSLRNGYACVIVAVGPHQLKNLMPQAALDHTYQPIYTCYVQYPEATRLEFPMLGMREGFVQWVFDRGALLGEKGRLACVISAQGKHQQMTQDELAAACDRELRKALPRLPPAQWSRVIAEKRATITCAPGLTRPSVRTATTGVFLAGDYTDPDYPPTLEAAVRSGVRAAELVASEFS